MPTLSTFTNYRLDSFNIDSRLKRRDSKQVINNCSNATAAIRDEADLAIIARCSLIELCTKLQV